MSQNLLDRSGAVRRKARIDARKNESMHHESILPCQPQDKQLKNDRQFKNADARRAVLEPIST